MNFEPGSRYTIEELEGIVEECGLKINPGKIENYYALHIQHPLDGDCWISLDHAGNVTTGPKYNMDELARQFFDVLSVLQRNMLKELVWQRLTQTTAVSLIFSAGLVSGLTITLGAIALRHIVRSTASSKSLGSLFTRN